MDSRPSKEQMQAMVQPLSDLDRKVLGGLVALWMAEPDKVKDREWTAQQFVHVATVAHGFDGSEGPATTEHVETIQAYARDRMEAVVKVGFSLFVRVAMDLQERGGGFNFDDAQAAVRQYLEVPPAS